MKPYNHIEIEKNGRSIGKKIRPSIQMYGISPSQNFMLWICFHILLVRACM